MLNRLAAGISIVAITLSVPACRDSTTVVGSGANSTATPTREQLTLVVSKRDEIPSELPWEYAGLLDPESPKCIIDKSDVRPGSFMSWAFYGGSLDGSDENSLEGKIFFFAMNPEHIRPMMVDLQDMDPELVRKLKQNQRGCLLGKQVRTGKEIEIGDHFKVAGLLHKGIDLEFELIGQLPEGRYNRSAIMNVEYLKSSLDRYERLNHQKHPKADRSLNLIYIRAETREAVERIKQQIETSSRFTNPRLRCETVEEGLAKFQKTHD